jgi:hypothetical protein
MRVCAESLTPGYYIIIQNTQRAKVHAGRIIIVSKAKGMMGVQPAVVGMTPGAGLVKYSVHSRLCLILFLFPA